jgi:predicted RNA methylase
MKRIRTKLLSIYWETRLGISTARIVESRSDRYHYVTLPYPAILSVIRSLQLAPSDVFVDLGCGKGRVVCCAARVDIREAIGIEREQELCRLAQTNALRLRGRRTTISIRHVSAENADYLNETVFYMFNPFGEDVMRAVMLKIASSLALNPRPVRLVYVKPMFENVLQESGWLEQYDRWNTMAEEGMEHVVSFWRSRP